MTLSHQPLSPAWVSQSWTTTDTTGYSQRWTWHSGLSVFGHTDAPQDIFPFLGTLCPAQIPSSLPPEKLALEYAVRDERCHVSFAQPAVAGRQLSVTSVCGCGTRAAWELSLGRLQPCYTHRNGGLVPREVVLLSSLTTLTLPLTSPHLITTPLDELDQSFGLIKPQRGNPN